MNPERSIELVSELRALGEPLRTESSSADLVDAVMTRVADSSTPVRPVRTRRGPRIALWRWVAACLAGLLAVVLLVPPIRATVFDWFDFGGIIVNESPGTAPTSGPPPPPVRGDLSLDRARQLVDFDPLVPRLLGAPDAVELTHDHRILAMSWDTPMGSVRLDQFDGRLEPMVMKRIYSAATPTTVRGNTALWFDAPHKVVVLDDGNTYDAAPRLAGSTLIWQRDDTTLRLEGDLAMDRARELARSALAR